MENWEKQHKIFEAKKWLNKPDCRMIDDFLAWSFDGNYYDEGHGIVLFKDDYVPIESIWTNDEGHAYIHCTGSDFEADFEIRNLNDANIKRVVDMLVAKYALV